MPSARVHRCHCNLGSWLGLVALVLLGAPAAAQPDQSIPAKNITVHAAGIGRPWINLQDGRDLPTSYFGAAGLREGSRPLSMAAADFDLDGFQDLVSGYASGDGGVLTVQRGNIDAFAPQSPESFQAIARGNFPAPFVSEAQTIEVPDTPDFIGTGDFNRDKYEDIVTAAKGSDRLFFMYGNAQGTFSPPLETPVPGNVTALVTGEFNLPDTLTDVVVGLSGGPGPRVVIYQDTIDGSASTPTVYSLRAEATALALAQLDDREPVDLAIAAGREVVILYGGPGYGPSASPVQNVVRIGVPFEVRGLTIGNLIWDRDYRMELALLADDGSVHVFRHGELDQRPETVQDILDRIRTGSSPYSETELEWIRQALLARGYDEFLTEPPPPPGGPWVEAENRAALAPLGERAGSQGLIQAAQLSDRKIQDLLVLDPVGQVHLLFGDEPPIGPKTYRARPEPVSLPVQGAPVAALAMRLNVTTGQGLVLLREGGLAPSVLQAAPRATFTVTKTADTADGACNADCSLREAVIASNAAAGADMIMVPAGTYTLTRGPGDDDSTGGPGIHELTGDLDSCSSTLVGIICASGFDDNDLTVVGAGSGTTIIQAGTTNTNGIDRIFDIDPVFGGKSLFFSISGATLRFGLAFQGPPPFGLAGGDGGAIRYLGDGGVGFAHATLTVTSCILDQNKSDNTNPGCGSGSPAGAINVVHGVTTITSSTISNNQASRGAGGGILYDGGGAGPSKLTITGSSFTGNTAPGSFALGAMCPGLPMPPGDMIPGPGGGVFATGGSPTAAAPQVSVSTTSFMTNVAGQQGDGGGIRISVNPSVSIGPTVTFSSNTAQRHGGGVLSDAQTATTAGLVSLSGVTISSNTADSDIDNSGDGGGIFHNRGTLTIDGTNAISGNSAFNGGGIGHFFLQSPPGGNTSTITINMSTIGGAMASDGNTARGAGGGIYHDSTNETGTGSSLSVGPMASTITIRNNKANTNGGGLANSSNAKAALDRATVTDNFADNDNSGSGDGGGIFNSSANASALTTTANTTIGGTGNTAVNGGGISVTAGTVGITSSPIQDNKAKNHGGGVHLTGGTLTLSGLSLLRNMADSDSSGAGDGGGIFRSGGTLTLSGTLTIGSVSNGNSAVNGGGVFNNGTFSMTGGSIRANNAKNNGGGFNGTGGTVTLAGVTVQNNTANSDASGGGDGGGIYNNGATIGVTMNSPIGGSGNPNAAANGGGIASAAGALTYTGVAPNGGTIGFNTASVNGAGVHVGGGTVTLNHITLTGNSATGSGGGFFVAGGTLTANLCRIKGNSATSGTGVGQSGGTASVENDWWGCDGFPNDPMCDTGTGTFDADPRIDLRLTSVPAMVGLGGMSTLTASVTMNTTPVSIGTPLVLEGFTATFMSDAFGTINPPGSGPLASGMRTNGWTAGVTPAVSTVSVTVDMGTQTAMIPIVAMADLAVTKTESVDPVVAGSSGGVNNLTYVITVTNNGPDPATSVQVNETLVLPAGVSLSSATPSQGMFSSMTGVWTVGSLAVMGSATLTIVLNVSAAAAAGAVIMDSATSSLTDPNEVDPTPGNNTGTENTTVARQADLSVTKADSPDPVQSGALLTYTIDVTNGGVSNATSAMWSDPLPAGTNFQSVNTPAGWMCTDPGVGVNGTVSCSNPNLPPGGPTTFTLVVMVTAGSGMLSNTVTVTTSDTDPNAANNMATTMTMVVSADLAVTKVDSPDPVVAGNNLTYTVTVMNNGPSAAVNASLSDTLPAGTTFVSNSGAAGWMCTNPGVGMGGTIMCTNPSLANAASSMFTIVVNVAAGVADGAIITNSATATSDTGDPVPGNNTGTAMTTVDRQADLSVTKTDSPDPVGTGANLTYTIDVTNGGPSNATTAMWSDPLPAGTNFQSVNTPAGWTCMDPGVGMNGTVSCSNPNLPPGGPTTFTLVVQVTATSGTLTNTVTVASPDDGNAANNMATAMTSVISADLAVTKTDTPDPVTAGNNLTYTVMVTNNGPNDAQSVQMMDMVPAGTTFVSNSGAAGWMCTNPGVGMTGTITCSIATLTNGGMATFTIVVNVNPSASGMISNTASASSSTGDPTPGNNSATTMTTVGTSADLQVTKTDSPDPVAPDTNLTYTVTVTNAGPSDAQTVQLTDMVPTNTTFVSNSGAAGWMCTNPGVGMTGTITCTISLLAPGASVFTIVVHVDTGTGGQTISNTATVASATSDPNPGNESATAMTSVIAADLSATKTDTPDPVIPGNNLTYTISVNNGGPSPADSVMLTDMLPAQTTFFSLTPPAGWTCMTPSVGTGGTVSCTRTNPLPASTTEMFTLIVQVIPATPGQTVISNTASFSSSTPDPNGNNNSATTTTTTEVADLSVTKTDSPDPVLRGQNITYTISVTNAGPSLANNASLTDPLPIGTTFQSITPPAGWTCMTPAPNTNGTVSCMRTGGAMPVATEIFSLVVQVDANAPGGNLNNTATVAAPSDPNSGNNQATATTLVEVADLTVSKVDSPDPVPPGATLTYMITVTNNGPTVSNNVTMSDTLPPPALFQSVSAPAGWMCTDPGVGNPGLVQCTKASLAVGSEIITILVTANAGPGASIVNTAMVAAASDPNTGDNSSTATTLVESADLTVSKTDTPDPVAPGGLLTYTISVNNNGPTTATNAMMSDMLPAQTTFQSFTAPAGWMCTTPPVGMNGTVSCTKPTLAVGSENIVVVVQVAPMTPGGTMFTNTATVASISDPNTGNNSGSATTTVEQADLTVSKSDSPDPVGPGQNLTYTIGVTNLGPNAATNAMMSDTLPSQALFQSITPAAGWMCTTPPVGMTGMVSCSKGTMAVGGPENIVVVVQVDPNTPGGTTISNTATVAVASDPNPNNNSATASTFVGIPILTIDKMVDNPGPVQSGDVLTYFIDIENVGSLAASNTVVVDPVPAGTSYVAGSCTTPQGSCGLVGGNVEWQLGTVPVGPVLTLTFQVQVNPPPLPPGEIANFGYYVDSDQTDPVFGDPVSTILIPVELLEFESQAGDSMMKPEQR